MKSVPFENIFLDIHQPSGISENEKINLLYVLDGDAFSTMIAEAVKLQMRNSPKTGVEPTLIVGISYHSQDSFARDRRFLDFTPKKEKPAFENDKRKDFPEGGQIDVFLSQLNRVHEYISKNYSIRENKIGFFGHSLGGLCVLEGYLSQQLPFVTDYLAVSPSLWWDQGRFFERLERTNITDKKRVAIAVGEDEGDMVEFAYKAFIVLKEKQLVSDISYYKASEENHMSVVFQTISRNLRWFCK